MRFQCYIYHIDKILCSNSTPQKPLSKSDFNRGENENMATFTLYDIEHEERRVKVTIEEARELSTIKNLIREMGTEEGEIGILKSNSQETLDLMVQYVQYDVSNPEEIDDKKQRLKTERFKPLDEWELEFFNIDLSEIFPLMLLANYLE